MSDESTGSVGCYTSISTSVRCAEFLAPTRYLRVHRRRPASVFWPQVQELPIGPSAVHDLAGGGRERQGKQPTCRAGRGGCLRRALNFAPSVSVSRAGREQDHRDGRRPSLDPAGGHRRAGRHAVQQERVDVRGIGADGRPARAADRWLRPGRAAVAPIRQLTPRRESSVRPDRSRLARTDTGTARRTGAARRPAGLVQLCPRGGAW
jgi:hypothetical protein